MNFHVTSRIAGTLCGTAVCLAALFLAGTLTARGDASSAPVDPLGALQEGNRLFRNGQLEAAIEAYRAGYSASEPHPTLVYNLGTAYHHLGRLPEAILWYRRAPGFDDPWLRENLLLARTTLGSQSLPPGGFLGALTRAASALRLTGAAVAWGTLILLIVRSRLPPWVVVVAALISGSLYATATAVDWWGPRPSVLLKDCHTSAGELPAGTEVWVRRLPDEHWQVAAGSEVVCPAEAVALVFPDS